MDKLEEDGNGLQLVFLKQVFKVRKFLNAKETKSSNQRGNKIKLIIKLNFSLFYVMCVKTK